MPFGQPQPWRCPAGVEFESVKVVGKHPGETAGYRLPCFEEDGVSEVCEKVSYYTAEEKAEQEERIREHVRQFTEDLKADRCPVCHQPAKQRQVGPCVYGDPCGHRMFQGRAKAAR